MHSALAFVAPFYFPQWLFPKHLFISSCNTAAPRHGLMCSVIVLSYVNLIRGQSQPPGATSSNRLCFVFPFFMSSLVDFYLPTFSACLFCTNIEHLCRNCCLYIIMLYIYRCISFNDPKTRKFLNSSFLLDRKSVV